MFKQFNRKEARARRHRRVRRRAWGTAEKPRLVVYRSLQHISAQLVDDDRGTTLFTASTYEKDLRGTSGRAAAEAVGGAVAERAQKGGVSAVVFDRGGYLYHGRVAALADAARAKGLTF